MRGKNANPALRVPLLSYHPFKALLDWAESKPDAGAKRPRRRLPPFLVPRVINSKRKAASKEG